MAASFITLVGTPNAASKSNPTQPLPRLNGSETTRPAVHRRGHPDRDDVPLPAFGGPSASRDHLGRRQRRARTARAGSPSLRSTRTLTCDPPTSTASTARSLLIALPCTLVFRLDPLRNTVRPQPRAAVAECTSMASAHGRCLRRFRDHRRSREGDDVQVALPPRAPRAPRLPDHRRRGRRLDARAAPTAHARRRSRRLGEVRPRGVRPRSRHDSPTCTAISPTPPPTSGSPRRIGKARAPVFYLETPPSLFATVVGGLADAGLDDERARRDREAVRARPRLGQGARRGAAPLDPRGADLPRRPLPGQARPRRAALPPPRERDARAGLEQGARRERPDHDGRELRRRGPGPVLRRRRRTAGRGRQPPPAAARRGRDGSARARARPSTTARHRLLRAVADADPARYVRGQYTGYRATPGVAPRSTTETYAALELRIDNERWRGVPFFIRTGKHLELTQTELRLIFRDAEPLNFLAQRRKPSANELVLRIDPATGLRIILEAHRADAPGPEPITLEHGFRPSGRRGPDAVRDALRGRADGRPFALHPPGDGRGGVAHRAAAARLPSADAAVPARELGAQGCERPASPWPALAPALGARRYGSFGPFSATFAAPRAGEGA